MAAGGRDGARAVARAGPADRNSRTTAGISYAPSALFAIAFLFVLVMLVQFSMTISRLSDQNTALAQRLALLQQRLEAEQPGADGHGAAEEPVGAASALSGPTDPA